MPCRDSRLFQDIPYSFRRVIVRLEDGYAFFLRNEKGTKQMTSIRRASEPYLTILHFDRFAANPLDIDDTLHRLERAGYLLKMLKVKDFSGQYQTPSAFVVK